ncbi:cytochrome c5 [Catenovulum agarivorans DS-2]|uniref:Cytochrome c5 n=1 Tax=Catenovulum agarivorans DS-2 TaxID=1328313 RepID=W7QTJ7_9ALTE|nr:cytochrome c5 family protein [Catenovulum agarivorans]EWH11173.1 cytochrome c5 [Catenovulum agarivorans DS-2]
MKFNLRSFALLSALVAVPSAFAADMSDAAIKERIKPIGSVHIAGAVAQSASSAARSGADVFNASCTACHSAGVMGAPKPNVAGDWDARLEQGMDTLVAHAINGFNAMPPKGTCMDCSDDEIKAAIEYMIKDL